jgi:hypothetical protein
MSPIFDRLARKIADLFPERVQTEILTTYDGRIVIFEFNDHPDTTHDEVLDCWPNCPRKILASSKLH